MMKTMKIEKKLLFADKIQGVNELQAEEKLEYHKEADGSMRAVGPLFVKGKLVNERGEILPFQEVLDMDVLAPSYKLKNQSFALTVGNVQYTLEDDGITLIMEMNIDGLRDDEQQTITPKPNAYNIPNSVVPIEQEELQEASSKTIPEDEVEEDEESPIVEEFEDLFEEADTTYTSYRMVVAQRDDTYGSIAKRYQVNEEDLRNANRNKDVAEKTLVVLPF